MRLCLSLLALAAVTCCNDTALVSPACMSQPGTVQVPKLLEILPPTIASVI